MSLSGSQKAYQYALSGAFRSGASRSAYVQGRAFISIGGVWFPQARPDAWAPGILYDSLSISNELNDHPDSCTFKTWQYVPALGSAVYVKLGSMNGTSLFGGYVQSVQQSYQSLPKNLHYDVSCIDWGGRLDKHVAVAQYKNLSVNAIIADLFSNWAPAGYTLGHVEAGLQTLDEITFTNARLSECLSRLAQRIGAYWYVDYQKSLHYFITADPGLQQPEPLIPTHKTLSNVRQETDLSQMVTRVQVEGGGGNALVPVPPGATGLPLDTGGWYESGGGQVISGPQRITYSGLRAAGAGALVGPGVTPSTALQAVAIVGAGMELGAHEYAYTWKTAGGETPPSPIPANAQATAVTVAGYRLANPTTAPGAYQVYMTPGYTTLTVGWNYHYVYTYLWVDAGVVHSSLESLPTPPITLTAGNGAFHVTVPNPVTDYADWIGAPGGSYVSVFRSDNGGPRRQLGGSAGLFRMSGAPGELYHITDFSPTSAVFPGPWPEYPLNSAQFPNKAQVSLTGIARGPAGTTARKIYRSLTNTPGLKLLTTISDNTTTTYTDAAPDATLGAAAPTVDTSGLSVTAGQINPGDASILTSGTGWADPLGGWVIIGNGRQAVSYTGVSGNTLVGIPASGFGAIYAPVTFNSTITTVAALVGIPASGAGSIRYDIKQGDAVNLWISLDSESGIALLASLLGDDGIQTEYIQDRRLGATECRARARALLAMRGAPLVTVSYTSRDLRTRAGATIVVNLPAPTNIVQTLKAQSVTISKFHRPEQYPTFAVTASTERYSFEDLLRDLQKVRG